MSRFSIVEGSTLLSTLEAEPLHGDLCVWCSCCMHCPDEQCCHAREYGCYGRVDIEALPEWEMRHSVVS